MRTNPKDVFLHLLAMVALYTSAVSFLVLVFQYINLLLPDVLEAGFYAREAALGSIRWSVAVLIVAFPAYLFASRMLSRGYAKDSEKRASTLRKWLVYFTLFIAGLVVGGDLITLIYNFLGGDLTLRFVLKVCVVFFVAGSTFMYYLWDIKRE